MPTRVITYQAQLSLAESLARVRDVIRVIEGIGGRVEFLPTGTEGITTVRLLLPMPYTPGQFLSDLPFYQM